MVRDRLYTLDSKTIPQQHANKVRKYLGVVSNSVIIIIMIIVIIAIFVHLSSIGPTKPWRLTRHSWIAANTPLGMVRRTAGLSWLQLTGF